MDAARGAPIDGPERQAILGPDERDLVAQHARGVLDVVVQLGDGSVDVGQGVDAQDIARWLIELPQAANSGDIYAVAA